MKKWIKSINDFMLDANRALPEVIRFWVFFMLGMCISFLVLGRIATYAIFGGIVIIEFWALIVQVVRERREEKARLEAYKEMLEKMKKQNRGLMGVFNEMAKNLDDALHTVFYGEEKNED